MIRLGHIEYSNCFPVHALLVDRPPPADIGLVVGVPALLNRALAEGRIDVAPCSSIELARHADRYRVLPDFAIAADGAVQSILFESTVPLARLDGAIVCVPTASATSVVLARILLEQRFGVRPEYRWFDQSRESDPVRAGAAAALWIGDVALRRPAARGRELHDLGALWHDWTNLPFVFAVWQTRLPAGADDAGLSRLHQVLLRSRAFFDHEAPALAARHAATFDMDPDRLLHYWRSLVYRLDERTLPGMLHFFECAAALAEAQPMRTIRWVDVGAAHRTATGWTRRRLGP